MIRKKVSPEQLLAGLVRKSLFSLLAGLMAASVKAQVDPPAVVGGGEGLDQCLLFVQPGTTPFDISAAPDPVNKTIIPKGTVIGDIQFSRYLIFDETDPAENNWLFRFADYLHIDTQERVIDDLILIEPGDPYEARVLDESARILREADYLYDARVWPYRLCGNTVDVEVLTREVWTLSGGFSASRSGGSKEDSIYVNDANFWGRGETVSIAYSSTTDRDGWEFNYKDPSVAGSRHTLDLFYADNSDGAQSKLNIERPFYSLDSRYAWGMLYNKNEFVADVYELGEDVASYKTIVDEGQISVGTSSGWQDGIAHRWWLGLVASASQYDTIPGEVAPEELPDDREINYPYIASEKIEEDFIKVSNLNRMHSIEDYNLGFSWNWLLGYSDEHFGSDRDRLVFQAGIRDAQHPNEQTLMQLDLSVSGFWLFDIDKSEQVIFEANWRYYDGLGRKHGTYLAADYTYARNLLNSEQILMGSEEYLRGYPARYQNGDRSFVFTAEHRYYTDWHLFRLLRIGGAVFFDVGRAWDKNDSNDGATGWLADAGFGLRLSSSRAQTKRILHVDFAFPLERFDDIDSVQILIEARQSF